MWKRRKLLGRDLAGRWRHRGETAGPVAESREPRRPRVLIEEPDAAEAFAYWSVLTGNGYEVSWCPGPAAEPQHRCPLVASGRCGLVASADVVVSSLDLHRESSQRVMVALERRHPETPVIVQAPQHMLARSATLFDGVWEPMRMPVTRKALLDTVALALAKPSATAPG